MKRGSRMKHYQAELVVDSRCVLGEGPTWDSRDGSLYWLDIEGKKLHRYIPKTGRHEVRELPHRFGSIVMRESGGAVFIA